MERGGTPDSLVFCRAAAKNAQKPTEKRNYYRNIIQIVGIGIKTGRKNI
jgi:hypothetical protein